MSYYGSSPGTLDITALKFKWKGEWSSTEIYSKNDVVRMNGSTYFCKNNTLWDGELFGIDYRPDRDNTNWGIHTHGYVNMGGWMPQTIYKQGDIVSWNGSMYMAKTTTEKNSHPLYKNGVYPNPDWESVFDGHKETSKNTYGVLPNSGPLGWVRNNGSVGKETNARTESWWMAGTQNGSVRFGGRSDGRNGVHGFGENWTAVVTGGQAVDRPITLNFQFFDWLDRELPTPHGDAPRCIQLECGYDWAIALFDNGEVYHWGYGGNGENGNGTTSNWSYPQRVGFRHSYNRGQGDLKNTKIIKVASSTHDTQSAHHIIALDENGNVWTWGYNGYGQLGIGDTTSRNYPIQLDKANYFGGRNIIDIWVGGDEYGYNFAMDDQGDLWSWGYNGYGFLGHGDTQNHRRPQMVKYNWAKYGGIKKVNAQGKDSYGTTIVLTNDGSLHGCGYNAYAVITPGTASHTWRSHFKRLVTLKSTKDRPTKAEPIRHSGNASTVLDRVDDFWVLGTSSMSMIIKEKETGAMFAWGYASDNWMAVRYNDYNSLGNAEYVNSTTYYPAPVDIPSTNIKDVIRTDTAGNRGVIWIDEYGRAFGSGYNGNSGLSFGWQSTNTLPSNIARHGQLPEDHGTGSGHGVIQIRQLGRIGHACGFGNSTQNNIIYLMQDGSIMATGSDTLAYSFRGEVNGGGVNGGGGNTYSMTYTTQ